MLSSLGKLFSFFSRPHASIKKAPNYLVNLEDAQEYARMSRQRLQKPAVRLG